MFEFKCINTTDAHSISPVIVRAVLRFLQGATVTAATSTSFSPPLKPLSHKQRRLSIRTQKPACNIHHLPTPLFLLLLALPRNLSTRKRFSSLLHSFCSLGLPSQSGPPRKTICAFVAANSARLILALL